MRSPFAWFRAVLCLSTALMMAISWPLWVSGGLFPRVPFVGGLRTLPVWASWARFAMTLGAMVAASAGFRWRRALGVALGLSAWMVLEDQFRLQPWMYQFLLMAMALAACPPPQAAGLCRLFVVALYFHSGLSKLDYTFLNETGPHLLGTLSTLFGREVRAGPRSPAWQAAVLAMPCWEIAIAAGLALRLRRLGVAAAAVQHLALIGILGPMGLGHSAIVLLWNAALIPQVIFLFWPFPGAAEPTSTASLTYRLAPVARLVMLLAALLPFGERWGLWDTWPSFGLYAGENERLDFTYIGIDTDFLPDSLRRHVEPDSWSNKSWLRLQAWSLQERRVPLYPSARALNGVAEAVATRHGGPRNFLVYVYGRADRRTGVRTLKELSGLPAIRRHGDSFLLNAHPAP